MNVSKVDIIFSKYIRLKNANDNGVVRCYTCGKNMSWTQAECGHYIPRAHMATRFLEMNCHPQCFTCNHELRGNLEIYRNNLLLEYGIENVEYLERLKNETNRLLPSELEELYNIYKWKCKCLTK